MWTGVFKVMHLMSSSSSYASYIYSLLSSAPVLMDVDRTLQPHPREVYLSPSLGEFYGLTGAPHAELNLKKELAPNVP